MHRLTAAEQFRLVYREGRRASNNLLTLYGRRNGLAQCRMGIAVPGRLGKAVTRNRVRRKLREAFRSVSDLPGGVDFVVVAKDAAADAPLSAMIEALGDLLPRVARESNAR